LEHANTSAKSHFIVSNNLSFSGSISLGKGYRNLKGKAGKFKYVIIMFYDNDNCFCNHKNKQSFEQLKTIKKSYNMGG
jgi:hypothetical protein